MGVDALRVEEHRENARVVELDGKVQRRALSRVLRRYTPQNDFIKYKVNSLGR